MARLCPPSIAVQVHPSRIKFDLRSSMGALAYSSAFIKSRSQGAEKDSTKYPSTDITTSAIRERQP
jgi:hypothetical protein